MPQDKPANIFLIFGTVQCINNCIMWDAVV